MEAVPVDAFSHERRHEGSQSVGQPSSLWKLPGATAITVEASVTQ